MPVTNEKKLRSTGSGVCHRILVGTRDENQQSWLRNALREWGYPATTVTSPDELAAELERCSQNVVVVLDDDFYPDGPVAALASLLLDGFAVPVLFLGDPPADKVVERTSKMGAVAFSAVDSELKEFRHCLNHLEGCCEARLELGVPLLGRSSAIRELRDLIRNVAVSNAPVMITGESGTGKELVARAIHDLGVRALQEFVPVNVAALPETLIESMLFGHEKGSFTGADQRQGGYCERAHRGTLFLDEIGEMNRDLQPKLLRFLQNLTVQRIGATTSQKVDVRIISATNRDVKQLIDYGLLREDLFFRLHVIPVYVPPLRERRDDIPLLANAFLKRKCPPWRNKLSISEDLMER
ncbi:MAG: sigma-54-dependent Fis family transcriptional regulator, partial [Planctomyces sp.]|nr:sigma-54-dependent Fis family transcriptional regulator [Planctomyces sp.]